jgi:hypothetical protein
VGHDDGHARPGGVDQQILERRVAQELQRGGAVGGQRGGEPLQVPSGTKAANRSRAAPLISWSSRWIIAYLSRRIADTLLPRRPRPHPDRRGLVERPPPPLGARMGKFKSGTARQRDPREQLADPPKPGRAAGSNKGRGCRILHDRDGRRGGRWPLLRCRSPPARGAHAIVAGHHARPGGGRKPQLGSRSIASAIMSPRSSCMAGPPAPLWILSDTSTATRTVTPPRAAGVPARLPRRSPRCQAGLIYLPSAMAGGRGPYHRRVLRRPNSGALSGATARAVQTSLGAAPLAATRRHLAVGRGSCPRPDRLAGARPLRAGPSPPPRTLLENFLL